MSQQQTTENVKPECGVQLVADTTEWLKEDSNVYPTGWPRLCPKCFPEVDPDDDGRDDSFDHAEVVDHLLRTSGGKNAQRKMHRVSEAGDE